jgi:hypothetical protein
MRGFKEKVREVTTQRATVILAACGLLAALLLSPAATFSQDTPHPYIFAGVPVDETAQELADEYTDILERLQDLIVDYTDYLGDIGDKNLTAELSFSTFATALNTSAYEDDPDKLAADLDAFSQKLSMIDRDCGKHDTKRTAKGCRVARSLSREINLLQEQLASYEDQVEETSYSRDQIRRALKEAFAGNKETNKAALDIARKAMEQAAKELQRIDLTSPQAPHGAATPAPPAVRSYTKTKKSATTWKSTGSGTQRNASGVIAVTSPNLPVYISNPNGGIEITGSTDKSITASLEFEVSASSRTREKELAEKIGLELSGERSEYKVVVNVPQLSDPQTQILHNMLTVSVPATMKLYCKSAYGGVVISGMSGPVDATSSYASMEISGCSAGLRANNAMGELSIADCGGDLLIQNSYAGIELSRCNGTISVTNSYAPITVSNSRGRMTIANTGEISVTGHTGPVAITNQYGTVMVSDVKGEVSVRNAYQAITLENIEGRTLAENSYSPISVSDINGMVKLVNRYSEITGENLTGPFDVSNQNGEVELVLGRAVSGPCVINTAYAPVRIDVPRTANLLILAKTSNSEITSVFPLEQSRNGLLQSGVIRLGSAKDSISIINQNGEIEISASR